MFGGRTLQAPWAVSAKAPGQAPAGQEGRDGREEGRRWAPSYRKHFRLSPQWTGSTGHLAHRRAPRDFPRKIISRADLREKGQKQDPSQEPCAATSAVGEQG